MGIRAAQMRLPLDGGLTPAQDRAIVLDTMDTPTVIQDPPEVQLAEIAMVLARVAAKLDDIEEQLQELFERLNELELPYAGLRDEE